MGENINKLNQSVQKHKNTEKQDRVNWNETQISENRHANHNATKQILSLEDKINLQLLKKIITEKKSLHCHPLETMTAKTSRWKLKW